MAKPKDVASTLTFGNPDATHSESGLIAFTDYWVGKRKWSVTVREKVTLNQAAAALDFLDAVSVMMDHREAHHRAEMAEAAKAKKQAATKNKVDPAKASPAFAPDKVREILRQNASVGTLKDKTVRFALLDSTLTIEQLDHTQDLLSYQAGPAVTSEEILEYLFDKKDWNDLTLAELKELSRRLQAPNAEAEFASIALLISGQGQETDDV